MSERDQSFWFTAPAAPQESKPQAPVREAPEVVDTPVSPHEPDRLSASGQEPVVEASYPLSQIRVAISTGVEDMARKLDHLKYRMGAKGGGGAIDCSGFLDKAIQGATKNLKREGFRDVLDDVEGKMGTSSAYQFKALADQAGAQVIDEHQMKAQGLRGGMVIAFDTGHKSWEGERPRGIDHIAITYEDKDGQVMVAQSSSGKGVHVMPVEQFMGGKWMNKALRSSRISLYAVDLADIAQHANGMKPGSAPEERVAVQQEDVLPQKARYAGSFAEMADGPNPIITTGFNAAGAASPPEQVSPEPQPAAAAAPEEPSGIGALVQWFTNAVHGGEEAPSSKEKIVLAGDPSPVAPSSSSSFGFNNR